MFHYNMAILGITLIAYIGLTLVCSGLYFYIYFLCFFLLCLFNMFLFLFRGGGFALKLSGTMYIYIYIYIYIYVYCYSKHNDMIILLNSLIQKWLPLRIVCIIASACAWCLPRTC